MKIKNSKKQKILARILLMTLPISGYLIHQSLPVFADDSDNEFNLDNDTIKTEYFYGGNSDTGEVTNNKINFWSGTYNNLFHAGNSISGNVSNNVINVYGGKFTDGWLSGAYLRDAGISSNNVVNIYGGTFNVDYIEGSWGEGIHNNNRVNIFGGTINGGIISGSWVQSNTTTSGNSVNISGGTINNAEAITGGYITDDGNVSDSNVNISGGTVNGDVQGGYIAGSGDATGNKVNISGNAKINGEIIGGYIGISGNATDNEINIYDSPDLKNATIYAGKIGSNTDLYGSNNSLNIHTKGIVAQNVGGFDNLNYYFPSNLQNGDTIVTLTNGSTNLSNTAINIKSAGGINLNTGDTFTLLRNDNGIRISNVTNSGIISEGISLDYSLVIPEIESTSNGSTQEFKERSDVENNLTKITAVVGELKSNELKSQTSLLTLTPQASVILAQSGEERIVNWLPPEEDYKDIDIVNVNPHNEFRIFANSNFSSLKTKTGNGSFVRSRNGGTDIGFAKAVESSSGNKLVFAPVFDYGAGNYDSYLKDGTHGHGASNYYAGGFIFRKINKKSGFYYEGSARFGRTRSNFSSNDFIAGGSPVNVSYSVSAPLYAGHIHIGKIYPINRENTLQVYGQYFHTHQSGMDTTLSSGEDYNFDSIDSGRLRTGFRLIRKPNKKNTFYSGLAYQYEFNGDSIGHYKDYSTSKSNMKGSSGMLEFGWQVRPTKKSPWMLDLNLVGWIGYQKGLTCQAKAKKAI